MRHLSPHVYIHQSQPCRTCQLEYNFHTQLGTHAHYKHIPGTESLSACTNLIAHKTRKENVIIVKVDSEQSVIEYATQLLGLDLDRQWIDDGFCLN